METSEKVVRLRCRAPRNVVILRRVGSTIRQALGGEHGRTTGARKPQDRDFSEVSTQEESVMKLWWNRFGTMGFASVFSLLMACEPLILTLDSGIHLDSDIRQESGAEKSLAGKGGKGGKEGTEGTGAKEGKEGKGGGQTISLHLPFPKGHTALCTQGADDDFSHDVKSTKDDLDFDTSNTISEELYAPASGIAYVYLAVETGSPFGNHICIDIGGGKYVVIAHLQQILISDGAEVAVGQLIGLEGCTGMCTGDHVHIGLHEGDPHNPAEQGVSIPTTYLVTLDTSDVPSSIASEDFVCGTGGDGEELGDYYTSALPVIQRHPDGTLIMSAHNPKVYLLEHGKKSWMLNEQVFWSYGYNFANVLLVSDEELDCYPEGPMIDTPSLVDAVIDPSGSKWLIVGSTQMEDQYRIHVNEFAWQGVLASWGLFYSEANPPQLVELDHSYLSNWPAKDGFAQFRTGTLIKEATASDVYVAGPTIAMPVKNWQTFLMMGFVSSQIVTVEDGAVASIQKQIGDCQQGMQCVDSKLVTTCGTGVPISSPDGQGGVLPETTSDTEVETTSPEETIEDTESEPTSESDTPDSEVEPVVESDVETDTQTTPEEPENTPPSSEQTDSSGCSNGELACIRDLNANGIPETLLLADHLWLSQMLHGVPAYVYANGGCFDGTLAGDDLVMSNGSYYVLDFSSMALDCSSQLTLVSSIGKNGFGPVSDMSNWMWWQGAEFCAKGNSLCQLMNNMTSWEEWLLSVSWNPKTGLIPSGNGLTKNSQL